MNFWRIQSGLRVAWKQNAFRFLSSSSRSTSAVIESQDRLSAKVNHSTSTSTSSLSLSSTSSSRQFGFSSLLLSLVALTSGLTLLDERNRAACQPEVESLPQKKSLKEKYESFKEKTTGSYENRVRAFSHPLKVFQYFASINKNGEFYMTPLDFIISIIPYQSVETRDEQMSNKAKRKRFKAKCESALEFFRLADTDGDEMISYEEYIFFLSLLSTPVNDFKIAFQMFDLDGNGYVDLNEFQKFITYMNEKGVGARQGKRQRNLVTKELRHGLLEHFFGKAGNKELDFKTFEEFLMRLQAEVLKLEFFSYDVGDGDTISMKDFARSIVSYANHRELDDYAKRIEKLPDYQHRVTYEEFASFNVIVQNMDGIQYAISLFSESSKVDNFTRTDLRRAIKACTGMILHDDVLDMIFHIFDKDKDRQLDPSEFAEVIKARYLRGLDSSRDLGFARFLEKLAVCAKVAIRDL